MKTLVLAGIVGLALILGGCRSSRAAPERVQPAEAAAVYKAGHGLRLSSAARELVGLRTMDVTGREAGAGDRPISIPAGAVVRTVKGDFVYVTNGPWFLRTPVTVGATEAGRCQLTDGLYEGDAVVTEGARALWLAELQAVNGGVGCADGK